MLAQRTLKSLTRAVGVGLHSGERVELTLRPAPVDTGIVFRRIDLDPIVEFPASAMAVGDTRMAVGRIGAPQWAALFDDEAHGAGAADIKDPCRLDH